MTKMMEAKMDVVRFTGSDVIVASALNTMSLSGMADGEDGNAKLNYMNDSYSVNNLTEFYTTFGANNHTNIDQYTPIYIYPVPETGPSSLGQLSTWDVSGNEAINGTYYWNGESFRHQ